MRASKNVSDDRIERLFFISSSMQQMLARNPDVLILDCTYKTNRYKMSLLVITEVTNLNTSFYADFCFLRSENIENYV